MIFQLRDFQQNVRMRVMESNSKEHIKKPIKKQNKQNIITIFDKRDDILDDDSQLRKDLLKYRDGDYKINKNINLFNSKNENPIEVTIVKRFN